MVEANVAKRPTTEEDVLIDESMCKEELLQAAIKIKAQLSKANKKLEKLEQRYIGVLKERKQAQSEKEKTLKQKESLMKLVKENDKSIEALEEEVKASQRCLNLVLGEVPGAELFTSDNKITWEKCSRLFQELRAIDKDKLETVKQQAFQHATQNSMNAL